MIVKTGLLIVSNPKHIGKILPSMTKHVNNTLYIQLISALTDPFGSYYSNVYKAWPAFSQTIKGIYSQAAKQCNSLDIRVLLSGLKYKNLEYLQTKRPIDLIIFDAEHPENDIDIFIKNKIRTATSECKVLTVNCGSFDEPEYSKSDNINVYKHTVIGGTFDRLHIGHKILLTEAALRASEKVTVGVTKENMVQTKMLWELIEPIDKRVSAVNDFLEDINGELERNVVPIGDLYGPTKDDPTLEMIVVSAETARGAVKINELRSNKDLKPLDVVTIELVDESCPCPVPDEESKISSSTARIRLLGTVTKPVLPNKLIPNKPYIIGLAGGIGTGKSNAARVLGELGAFVIECDKVAHRLYKPGERCYELVVKAFGKSILCENGEVNRKALGALVFKNPDELQKLNSLIWPAIMEDVQEQIKKVPCKVVVIEAAILLGAGWDKYCHEVWITIAPTNDIIRRLQERNGLTEDEAKFRLSSQISSKQYVDAANVVFYTAWPPEYTRKQIDRAWELLQSRILS